MAEIIEVGKCMIILPNCSRLPVFNAAHQTPHFGVEKTIDAEAQDFWWPTLKPDVTFWTKSCIDCKEQKLGSFERRPKDLILSTLTSWLYGCSWAREVFRGERMSRVL